MNKFTLFLFFIVFLTGCTSSNDYYHNDKDKDIKTEYGVLQLVYRDDYKPSEYTGFLDYNLDRQINNDDILKLIDYSQKYDLDNIILSFGPENQFEAEILKDNKGNYHFKSSNDKYHLMCDIVKKKISCKKNYAYDPKSKDVLETYFKYYLNEAELTKDDIDYFDFGERN
ncbi:MAG: hypothetical protein RR425_06840 [Erysipelotrichales bacterium]